MLTRDVRFEGWTVQDWLRLLSLFERPAPPERPGAELGGLFVIHDGARTLKLLHTQAGRLSPSAEPWPEPLSLLADRHHAGWVVSLHLGALEEVMERFGARATRAQDIAQQALLLAQIVREMALEGALDAWPRSPRQLPLPSPAVVARTLDGVCPVGKTLAVGLFEQGELWTAAALRRTAQGFDLVLGPEELRGAMGLLSGDWRRDYRHLAWAIEDRSAPLGAGLFTEVGILRQLTREGEPGSWARAVAVRDVIVAPMSAAVALPLVVDAFRGAFRVTREAVERWDPTGKIAPVLRAIGEHAESSGVAGKLRGLLTRGDDRES